ncbi:MAG: YgiQ family radical SAM protein [Oscillospiraceae bacterium]|nr:YgiQ family radical SAM protein [Oscillospiraceae bacterium]
MISRGWYYYDFLLISGDAYVDHPSFGAAVIGRVLEAEGFRVAILAQPAFRDESAVLAMGKPRYAALVTSGNLDSMVAHYTAAKRRRGEDFYSPGKKAGLRPDRALTVYCGLVRSAFPELPIIIGGLEASLRRFAHYDYWDNRVRRPILFDTGADYLVYGMGENAIVELAKRMSSRGKPADLTDVRGTGFIARDASACSGNPVVCESYEEVSASKEAYARATMLQHYEHDAVRGRTVVQECDGRALVIRPPARVPSTGELDRIYSLPYTREPHPMYADAGGVPAIDEVRFSIIHNRGCFGGCNFCALAFHQGRTVSSRSHESVVAEAVRITKSEGFKGYIHDVGGPTANFRRPSCQAQLERGMCPRNCLSPEPCPSLEVDHTDYVLLLRRLAALPGVKKVFVRSGVRFDYMVLDGKGEFFAELVKNHISGQLKVAPEHCVDKVLYYMEKPRNAAFEKFSEKFLRLNERYGKRQFLVPYLISSHPGSTLRDAIALAEYLNRTGRHPEQVQDFYPTPGTISTCMYYTGLDPRTMEPVYVPRAREEKAMQRALLQWRKPDNRAIVRRALEKGGRRDLIGYGKRFLVPPAKQGN